MAEEVNQNAAPDTSQVMDFEPGVLAAVDVSDQPDAELSEKAIAALRDLRLKASKRDYPARLTEVIQAWEAALFWRGFQFLLPRRGGGWTIPGENNPYGADMQLQLSMLPTNIYSSYGQMIVAALTRQVPSANFQPQDVTSAVQITAAESAQKFTKVIERNNDLLAIQTDAVQKLWTDGRAHYWTRFVKDGQKYGWEENDEEPVVPEDEPPTPPTADTDLVEKAESTGDSEVSEEPADAAEGDSGDAAAEETPIESKRRPRGQEVRTAHGKLEVKIAMMANDISDTYFLNYATEVDISTAKGMFPKKADKIKAGGSGFSESEIDKLARTNVKLGMQASYVTSDSIADDVTIDRTWFRPSTLMRVEDAETRAELIEKFPDGVYVCYAGEVFIFARNESMDWSWTIIQAFSGDGQNRNALGSNLIPVQKRLNNWLDLMNDIFVRTIGKRWYDNVAFADAAIGQAVVPGDAGLFVSQPGKPVDQLVFVEPAVNAPMALSDFVKEYSGELAQLLSGAFPALFGGSTGSNDTASGIGMQRDAALGRIGPTWHAIKAAEAIAMRQAVRWGAKCRDTSINEAIPGSEAVIIEVNDLDANILCFAESDENFPESYSAKQQRMMVLFQDKNPELQEVLYNASNLEVVKGLLGLSDLYIPQVSSHNKQLGEIDIMLRTGPAPNPQVKQAQTTIANMKSQGVDPAQLAAAEQEIQSLPQEFSSVSIDAEVEDNETEAASCFQWLMSVAGRKAKRDNPNGYSNVRLHYLAHKQAAAANAAASPQKPVSKSIALGDLVKAGMSDAVTQLLSQGGIQAAPPVAAGAAPLPKAA